MGTRRKGRILAFQALYSWDAFYSQSGKASIPEGLLDFPWTGDDAPAKPDDEITVFSRLLVTGTVENINAIDDMIQKHLKNWELKRLNRVDLALLRMSVYCLMFQTETHPSIIIDEAVEISKDFGTDDSYRFINGVLDNIRKSLVPCPEPAAGRAAAGEASSRKPG